MDFHCATGAEHAEERNEAPRGAEVATNVPFLRRSALPCLTEQMTKSPIAAAGRRFWTPERPFTEMMKRDLAPVLSAQLRMAPAGRPAVMRNLPPTWPPRPVGHGMSGYEGTGRVRTCCRAPGHGNTRYYSGIMWGNNPWNSSEDAIQRCIANVPFITLATDMFSYPNLAARDNFLSLQLTKPSQPSRKLGRSPASFLWRTLLCSQSHLVGAVCQ
jgi:hypothetical protein